MKEDKPYGNILNKFQKNLPKNVFIWDETLRDGEQAPGVFFTKSEKLAIAKKLSNMGVNIIDLGFAGISKEEDQCIRTLLDENLLCDVGVTVRANIEDIDMARALGVNRVFAFISTSPVHIKYKLNKKPDEIESIVEKSITYARDHGIIIDFISEDTVRSDLNYVIKIFNLAADCGANILMITDTVGCATPSDIKQICKYILKKVKHDKIGIHCHNDLGLATANTISAVEEGIQFPTVTINGIGERSGNANFAEVALALESIYNVNTSIKLDELMDSSRLVESTSGIYLPVHQPIVGYNSFRHESGIHVDGLLKEALTYEPINPNILNRNRSYVLGKHSGRSLIKQLLEKKNINFTDDQLKKILALISTEKDRTFETKKDHFYRLKNEINEYNKNILGFSEDKLWRIVYSVVGGYDEADSNPKNNQKSLSD